jgi:transposase
MCPASRRLRWAILEPYADALIAQAVSPSMTLKELQSWLETEHALTLSIAALNKFLRLKLGFRYKKHPFTTARV